MSVIYEPRGKAREYCELSVNLYHGCDHGCLYCYAPNATYKSREEFGRPKHRKEIIEQIRKDLRKNHNAPLPPLTSRGGTRLTPSLKVREGRGELFKGREVLLCFTCDPYSTFAASSGVTRQAIEALHDGGCRVTILSKGGRRSISDLDILRKGDKLGATLTFTSREDSEKWEPGAAMPEERLEALMKAHDRGITTWASMEPVIDPEQTLELIRQSHEFVDLYKVGKWNHDARAKEIDWKAFGKKAISLLKKYKKKYYIKQDLAVFLGKAA